MTPKEQKAYNLIGIAKKAGKVIGGTDMVADRIREKRNAVKAVLISSDASENTLKKIINTATFYKVPAVKTNIDKATLAKITGSMGERSVIGITDEGLAKAIMSYVTDETE
ncbi:MAG: hypothetical protein E7634_03185 [Ruminococcaceae bacterium]|nr:hypothetical protein [Oscillospiraceae bacterium]